MISKKQKFAATKSLNSICARNLSVGKYLLKVNNDETRTVSMYVAAIPSFLNLKMIIYMTIMGVSRDFGVFCLDPI